VAAASSKKIKAPVNPLFAPKARNFGIGGAIQPTRDLTRYIKWPKYIRLQRQKTVLLQRLKVPPTLNQFSKTLDKHTASQLMKLAAGYRPETKAQKKERITAIATTKASGKAVEEVKRPEVLKFGINHVTALIEKKKAKLVVIAHDVDPIELIVWLPALCRKMDVPYCIVKGKSRLGALIHQKQASAICFTDIKQADLASFNKLCEAVNANFTEKWEEDRKVWGGHILGQKSNAAHLKLAKIAAKEVAMRIDA